MSGDRPNLRERRRTETQRMIQSHAMRLFVEHGYDATTVDHVARASGVSTMTVYRHFPTKEDLVLYDQYDPLIAARVAARPADEPVVRRIEVPTKCPLGKAIGDVFCGAQVRMRRPAVRRSVPASAHPEKEATCRHRSRSIRIPIDS
ncbi:TetR/AcrR family transcriptional regulator [Nonomuraea sp. KM90]|uniref:TetR/AcrR family transcriptional regulator n=1 Tax=Nonomuraea sp. KM90 TaxID=3457428 RepID=UPI003FCE2B96